MQFNKTIKLLICFVMIFPYLLDGAGVSAASNYNHAELMDYEGYGEAMYNSIIEETTFITGQYTDNKEYVNNSIDQVKDYAKFWWEENKIEGEGVGAKLKDLFVKGAAYTLTVGDWTKKFFTDYGDEYHPPVIGNDIYKEYMSVKEGTSNTFIVNPGYKMIVGSYTFTNSMGYLLYGPSGTYSGDFYAESDEDLTATVTFDAGYSVLTELKVFHGADAREFYDWRANGNFTKNVLALNKFGVVVRFEKDNGDPVNLPPVSQDNPYDRFRDYVKNSADTKPMRTPEPIPSLTCPNGEKINLAVDGSTFLNSDGSIMLVNKDGTATVNGTSCALQWKTPEMAYVDDKAAMTDSEGNWIDMLTGEILPCVLAGECKPALPGEEVEELDKDLIEYVKNAYEYATGVLKTAIDGLKSLATGAKDLTALFGTFFSWLPKEMVVLMSSGLGIAIGLRLFRK